MTPETESKDGCADLILGLLCFVLLIPVSCIWGGYVFHALWTWFMVAPLGLPAITLPQAVGIRLVASFLTQTGGSGKRKKRIWPDVAESAFLVAAVPAMALLIGWIVQKWL